MNTIHTGTKIILTCFHRFCNLGVNRIYKKTKPPEQASEAFGALPTVALFMPVVHVTDIIGIEYLEFVALGLKPFDSFGQGIV